MSLAIRHSWFFITAACVFIPMTAYSHEISAPATATQMVRAANALLNVLSPGQQKAAWLAFEDDERFDWHHLSLNITIVEGHLFATAPRFLGANPAEVAEGDMRGVRTLLNEEYLARKLVKSLDQKQQRKAVFRNRAYRDIVTGSDEKVSPLELVGISAGELNQAQMVLLLRVIEEYVSTMPPEIARQRMDAIRRSGLEHTYFGWAGAVEPGRPHYYRIQGPTSLIEYDNVQNGANHIHTVWRDFDGDFGRDLLREHYRKAHQ